MGFGKFMLGFISLKKLAKVAKETSLKYNIPIDESILTDKKKLLDWFDDKENKKLFQQMQTSSLNTDVNPSTGLPMIDGCIDVGGNSYGS